MVQFFLHFAVAIIFFIYVSIEIINAVTTVNFLWITNVVNVFHGHDFKEMRKRYVWKGRFLNYHKRFIHLRVGLISMTFIV